MCTNTNPIVSVAYASTGNFQFMAIGATPDLARASLMAAWSTHCAETGADSRVLPVEDVNIVTGRTGQAFRDGDVYPRMANYDFATMVCRTWNDNRDLPLSEETQERIRAGLEKFAERTRELPRPIEVREMFEAQGFAGKHANCAPEDHDRTIADGLTEEEQARDADGLMGCNDCGVPTFYCKNTGWYHHVDPQAPACFLTD